jgi:hypothetical protein
MTRFKAVLDATGSFTTFATSYIQRAGPVPPTFEVTPAVLDEFQTLLSANNIRPSWRSGRVNATGYRTA